MNGGILKGIYALIGGAWWRCLVEVPREMRALVAPEHTNSSHVVSVLEV